MQRSFFFPLAACLALTAVSFTALSTQVFSAAARAGELAPAEASPQAESPAPAPAEAAAPVETTSPEAKALQAAAQNGDARAQYNLGNLYFNGQGIEQDYGQAAVWYQKAALQGNAEAQAALGTSYLFGRGIRRDPARAAPWLLKAAKQGNLTAEIWLANCYFRGWGVKQNDKEAYFWSVLATNAGDKTMIAVRDKAAGRLPPEDALDVRKRVQAWEPATAK